MHEKMRKLATLLMMVFALNAKAQQTPSYQHTIDLGVGLWISGPTVPGVIDHRSYDEIRHKGPIPSVTYQYMMNRHWGLGATASLLYYNKKMVYDDTGETIDKMSETALALMFTTRYYWRTKNWVRVYSSASVGFGYDWEKNYKIWKGNRQPDGWTIKIFLHGRFRRHDVDFPLICMQIRIFWYINIIDDEWIFVIAVDKG